MRKNTDILLIEEFLSGNTKAFDQLMANHYLKVLQKIKYYTKDEHLAKDLLQEVFVNVFQNLHQLKNKNFFKGWLAGIIRNVCNNYFRKERKKGHLISVDEFKENDLIREKWVEEDDDDLLIQQKVRDAVNRLGEGQKQVVEAFYFEDMSIDKIAAKLDISIPNVKVRLHRARKSLKHYLLLPDMQQGTACHQLRSLAGYSKWYMDLAA